MNSDSELVVPWNAGSWTNKPVATALTPLGLKVTATPNSDAWRGADDGSVASSQNSLLVDFKPGMAMEVEFIADMIDQFDQAGLFIRVSDENWAKAGMELVDGQLRLGAVVTKGLSDWSSCGVADWNGRAIRVRASWQCNTVVVRAKVDGEQFRLVRWFPLDESLAVQAGPYVASPKRAGMSITFTDWSITDADERVHERAAG